MSRSLLTLIVVPADEVQSVFHGRAAIEETTGLILILLPNLVLGLGIAFRRRFAPEGNEQEPIIGRLRVMAKSRLLLDEGHENVGRRSPPSPGIPWPHRTTGGIARKSCTGCPDAWVAPTRSPPAVRWPSARRTGITLLEIMSSIGTPIGRKRPSHKCWIVVCQKMRLGLVMPCQFLLIRGRPLASSVNAAIEEHSVKARASIRYKSLPKHHENTKRSCRQNRQELFLQCGSFGCGSL